MNGLQMLDHLSTAQVAAALATLADLYNSEAVINDHLTDDQINLAATLGELRRA